jgi:hypothetical protein
MFTRFAPVAGLFLALLGCGLFAQDKSKDESPRYAGPTEKGFLLPNGWTLTPAGKQVTITDLPLNIIPLTDNRHALVATSGFNKHELMLIDLGELKVARRETVRQSWYGLTTTPKQDLVWWSGGGGNMVHAFELKNGNLKRTSADEVDPKSLIAKRNWKN